MEYKIVDASSKSSPRDTGETAATATTLVNVEKRDGTENEDPKSSGFVAAKSMDLHVKVLDGKERAMNPAFRRRVLLQQQQEAGADNPHLPAAPRALRQREDWKVFHGFTGVFDTDATNRGVYESTVRPLLLQQFSPDAVIPDSGCPFERRVPPSLCVFTYGHTGSGKSHTLLGYDDKENAEGLYKYAARELMDRLSELDGKEKRRILYVRVTELYKDTVRDLLTDDDGCTVREDGNGVVRVRGPMVEDPDTGRIEQKVLGRACATPEKTVECIDEACANRRVGISTHHDRSSRSHLVVEIEVVTQSLLDRRDSLAREETQLTRLKWLQTEKMASKRRKESRPMPRWTEEYDSGMKLRNEIKTYESLVFKSQQELSKMEERDPMLGRTMVFCDLAGNEYARDSNGSTKQEREEAAEINKSLLAVKEMIRALNSSRVVGGGGGGRGGGGSGKNQQRGTQQHRHVSYRDSQLSMLLKRHLQGNGSRAVMMGHIGPSQEHVRKTINTLKYCSMAL